MNLAPMENRNPDGCANHCAPEPTQENQGERVAEARERIVELSKTVKNEGPARAARVAPAAWPSAVKYGSGLRNAMTNAAEATAGQIRYPQIKTAASATPYAGQTGPRLLLLMLAVAWPNFPAMKYEAKTAANCIAYAR
jgi:hypothetical protein